MRIRWFSLLGMLVVLSWASALAQDISFGPSIRVDDDTTDLPLGLPCMATYGDSIVYIAWHDRRDLYSTGYPNIYFSSSFDGGKTWTENLNVTDNSTPYPYLPEMETDDAGNIYLVWGDEALGNLYFSLSSDSGKSWSPPVMVNDVPGCAYGPSLAIDEEGIIYVTWSDERDDFWLDVYFARSADRGSTWTTPAVRVNDHTPRFQGFSDIVVHRVSPSHKNIYVCWTDGRNGHKETFFSKSKDGGKTWEENVRASDVDWADYPKMAVDEDGTIHLVYSGKQPDRHRSIFYSQSTDEGSTWLTPNTMVSPDTFSRSSGPDIAVDRCKNLYAVWKATPVLPGNELDYHIYFAMSRDSGRTWSDPIIRVDDSTIDFAEEPCISLADNRRIYVAWDGLKPPEEMKNIYFSRAQGPDWVWNNEIETPITRFSLRQNYPNPFNENTVIRYSLLVDRQRQSGEGGSLARTTSTSYVSLKVYNILGREVKTLVDGVQRPGRYSVVWDGKSNSGMDVASGVYFYQLKVGRFSQIKKMAVLR